MENIYLKSLRANILYAKNQTETIHREIVTKICGDDETNKKIYSNIRGLFYFALKHKELSSDNIEGLIRTNKSTFKILNHFISSYDNAVEELRFHGSRDMIIDYLRNLRTNKKIEEKTKEKIS